MRDLLRFNRAARSLIGLNGSGPTLGAFLEAGGYSGAYVLELETHDVEEDEREADAARSIVFSDEILAGVRS